MSQSKQIPVDGRKVNFVDMGSGVPFLLVHGFPLDHQMWRHQMGPLSNHFRVIALDLPGFGKSDPFAVSLEDAQASEPRPLRMEQFADWLVRFLDTLEIESVVYCGLSMGGYIGWEFAKRRRTRIQKLIACNTRAANDSEIVRRGRAIAAEGVMRNGVAQAGKDMVPKLFGASRETEDAALTSEVILSTEPSSFASGHLGMAERSDMTTFLGTIDFPTLFVAGKDDTITPADEMSANAALVADSKFICFDSAAHMVPLQQPGAFNEAVIDFVTT